MAGIKLKELLKCCNGTVCIFEERYTKDCPDGADCSEICKYFKYDSSGWTCENEKMTYISYQAYIGSAGNVPISFADKVVRSVSIGEGKGYRGKKTPAIKITVR